FVAELLGATFNCARFGRSNIEHGQNSPTACNTSVSEVASVVAISLATASDRAGRNELIRISTSTSKRRRGYDRYKEKKPNRHASDVTSSRVRAQVPSLPAGRSSKSSVRYQE